MPRRGRSASPTPRAQPRAPMARRSTAVPATVPPAQRAVPAAPPAASAAPQQPSMFGQMAATAGGVAIGSAVGHTLGHAMTGMFSGGGGSESQAAQPEQAYPSQQPAQDGTEPTGPCAWEIKQFLQCASTQSDLSLCQGFNEAIQQCKIRNNVP